MISAKTLRDFEALKAGANGYWSNRLISELQYLMEVSRIDGGAYDDELERAVEYAKKCFDRDETLTAHCAMQTEDMIAGLSPFAKKYTILCMAHAHIDMNWQWSYAETVAVTLDTFKTVLRLMDEYPDFKFSQSQASVYEIVEKYYPELLEQIKRRVHEGRWEVTASTWVEADKNIPNGESMSRHILYTKRYLSRLLDISPDSLVIDFEPDTFGHFRNVPEILSKGGIKYYYHCRGFDKHNVYIWEAESGSRVIAYREPTWYTHSVNPGFAYAVPEFCSVNHICAMPMVYGVGDHGGGPTRRDIERIKDMAGWPLYPNIKFSTFDEFYKTVELVQDKLPVVREELNFMFTGCYSSQSRIKTANRIAEARLNEAEIFSSMSAAFAGGWYLPEQFSREWKKVLFNQFHDILGGTGVIETREYALGQFQEVIATANTQASIALEKIASQIDLSAVEQIEAKMKDSLSEGAGVGFGVTDFAFPQVERGRGRTRIYHFFNPSMHQRHEVVELTVWDWPGNEKRLYIKDCKGNIVKHQLLGKNLGFEIDEGFGGHSFIKLLVEVDVPAMGYNTYILDEAYVYQPPTSVLKNSRIEEPNMFILENEFIRAEFRSVDMALVSFYDKNNNCELVDGRSQGGVFRLAYEDSNNEGMSAWFIERYTRIMPLGGNAKVYDINIGSDLLRQWISYSFELEASSFKATISLDRGSTRLDFNIECDWHERFTKGKGIPQLNFCVPLAYKCLNYRYDIPFSTIDRDELDMDVPANSWIMGLPQENSSALMLATNNRYGYRGYNNSLSVTLIRSSYEPDPYPEDGVNKIKMALFAVHDVNGCEPVEKVYDFCHPMPHVSSVYCGGALPPTCSFVSLKGEGIILSAIKAPEDCPDGSRLIFRFSEIKGRETIAVIKLARKVCEAYRVDLNEQLIPDGNNIKVDNNCIEFVVTPHSICSICVVFDKNNSFLSVI